MATLSILFNPYLIILTTESTLIFNTAYSKNHHLAIIFNQKFRHLSDETRNSRKSKKMG